ncbi:MAG: hypothetical protein IKE23_05275 [Exiguobacterium sp.]|nr:hypothetical protein [Exiguobacterium sp.]
MAWVTSEEFAALANEIMLVRGYTVSQIARVIGVPYAVVDSAMKGRSKKVRTAYYNKLKAHHDSLLLTGRSNDSLEQLRQLMTKHILTRRFCK